MIKRMLLILVVTLAVLGALFGARIGQIMYAKEHHYVPPPPTVAVTRVKTERWVPHLDSVGALKASAGVVVSNELPGKVSAIHFVSGEAVEQGQLLLSLDTETDEAELKRLEAARWLAKIKFDRAARLVGGDYVAKSNYDEAKAQLSQADASVVAQRALMAKKAIVAPFAGSLGIRRVDVGQYLPPGTPIVDLQSLATIYVDFALPERYLGQLAIGQKVEVSVRAWPDRVFAGVVQAIEPGVSSDSRSVKLRAELPNPDSALRPGMFAEVRVITGEPRATPVLLDTAVTYATYGDSVFVVREDGKGGYQVQQQPVQTGQRRGQWVEIVKGLEVGQMVVSAGQVKLRNGIPVIISDRPAPGERTPDDAPSPNAGTEHHQESMDR